MKRLFALLSFLFIYFYVLGQDQNTDSIDSIFSEWNHSDTPGGSVAVIRDGKIIFQKGYGIADLEHDIVNNPTTVFYIGSVSKQFVAFSILLLEEEGKLDLDAPIQTYLPDFPAYGNTLTIRHFIHHLSGVRDYLTLMDLKGKSYLDHLEKEEVYELIINQEELNFIPGEQYLYSNSCYFMLALIVEKVSGMPFSEYAKKNIFDPLGMVHSVFHDDVTNIIKNRAFSYEKTEDGFDNLVLRFDLVGSGGMYSNLEDLYLWDQNFNHNILGKGGQQIIQKMMTDGKFNNGESCGYAFAVANGNYKGLSTLSHGGALAGYRSYFLRFLDHDLSLVILSNRSDGAPDSKAYKLADILLKEFIEKESMSISEEQQVQSQVESLIFSPDQLEGPFEIEPGIILEITYSNGTLIGLQQWNNEKITLIRFSDYEYRISEDASIRIIFSDFKDGKMTTISVIEGANKRVLNRVTAFKNEIEDLNTYSGTYYSKELNTTYKIYLTEGQLFTDMPGNKAKRLKPYQKDQFTVEPYGILFRFTKENNQVKELRVDAGRVQNLYFEPTN